MLWTELNGSISSKFKKIEKATKIRKEKCCFNKVFIYNFRRVDDRQLTDKRSPRNVDRKFLSTEKWSFQLHFFSAIEISKDPLRLDSDWTLCCGRKNAFQLIKDNFFNLFQCNPSTFNVLWICLMTIFFFCVPQLKRIKLTECGGTFRFY